jgi:alpha-D-xyloside xylohydrolase
MEIRLPPDGADIYVFGGPTMLDAVRRYNLYCGGGTLPPKWGLGFWHRTPTLYSAEEVYAEAMEFRRRNFPCDVIGLEPGWHSTSYPVTYEWNRERYPNPAAFVAMMKERGFRINLWEHPYVSPEAGIYNKIEALSGTHTVWGGVAPDYSLTEASELYMSQHDKEHVELGVSGYKLDECDGSELTRNSWMFPAHAGFPSGHDGEQMRQLYGLMFQKMTADLYERRNLRTYGLVRASNAGASPLPYVLYSDLYDHRQYVRALCNASFCGLLWTPEVRKANDVEDWVRRMQTVCFSPLAMLNAWGDGTKPWTYPEAEDIIRHYIKLRIRLLPYLYSEFAKYEQSGVPPFRAMPLVLNSPVCNHATDGWIGGRGGLNTTDAAYGRNNEKDWDDQYMVGDALLVAPLFAGETGRDVLLPEGVWFGLETGERFNGGGVVRFEAELEQFPLFVREGTILPLMPAYDSIPESGTKIPIELVHFGSSPGEYHLYDDDGVTYDFKQGRRSWCKLSVSRTADGKYLGESHIADESYFGYEIVKWHFEQTKLPL